MSLCVVGPGRSDDRPLCIDLFCGKGGRAKGFLDAGYRVVGFDVEPWGSVYPGEFVRADVRSLDGRLWRNRTDVVVASPLVRVRVVPLRGVR